MDKRKITDLVEENYVFASVLFYFGIEFYNNTEKTLYQACKEHGLKTETVISELENTHIKKEQQDLKLIEYPVNLIIEYLKHKHYLFIKQTLPYLAKLINHYPTTSKEDLMQDIKFVFPMFVEDYIRHMYEEEDCVFRYILLLDMAARGKMPKTNIYYEMEGNSISEFAKEHSGSDDDMKGIRKITHGYQLSAESPVLLKVIYAELQAFEKNLQIHARIENDILFPKALILEKQLKKELSETIKNN